MVSIPEGRDVSSQSELHEKKEELISLELTHRERTILLYALHGYRHYRQDDPNYDDEDFDGIKETEIKNLLTKL